MELWIRSQNKEILIKVDRIGFEEFDNGYGIVTYERIGTKNEFGLGLYKTRERALKVLNEIQNILMPRISYTPIIEEDINPKYEYKHFTSDKGEVEILELSTYVYEMPKE